MRTRLAALLLAALPLAAPAAAQDLQARAMIGAALTRSAARTIGVDGYHVTGTGMGIPMTLEVRKVPGQPGSFPRWGSRLTAPTPTTDAGGVLRGMLRMWLGIETLMDRGRLHAGPIARETLDGRPTVVVSFADVRPFEDVRVGRTPISARIWLDSATLVPLRIANHGDLPDDAVSRAVTATLTLSDYRPEGRLLLPRRMVFEHEGAVPPVSAEEAEELRAHLVRLHARAAAATGDARAQALAGIVVTEAMVTGKPPRIVIEVDSVRVIPRTR